MYLLTFISKESVKREAGNLSIHNKFEKYNGVPIDLRLKALKRILGEPDAQYSEYLQRSQYNLKVFFDEIDDEYFSQNFIDRYEKALCVSHKVEALKENFPNLGSCLYVVKGQKAEGSVGRPRKDKDAIEWGLDMQKMMVSLFTSLSINYIIFTYLSFILCFFRFFFPAPETRNFPRAKGLKLGRGG